MQEQRGELAEGGRGSDTASHFPAVTLGQAAAAVLDGLYESILTPLGVALAISLDRLSKSLLVVTLPPETVARPVHVSLPSSRKWGAKLTELVLLLEVHVDNTTRPDTSHLLSVESTNLGEETGTGSVATVLSKEDRDVVLFEFLGTDIEARFLERRVTAPRVDVVAPEVNGVCLVTAVEVSSEVLTNLSIVVGGVSHTNLAVVLALDVCLGVANSGLDESAGNGVVGLVGNLVTGKEAKGIVILHHLIDNGHVALVDGGGPSWVVTDDGVLGLRQVGNNVDASIGECVHAVLVVLAGVDGVDTDGVGLELLEVLDVTLA